MYFYLYTFQVQFDTQMIVCIIADEKVAILFQTNQTPSISNTEDR